MLAVTERANLANEKVCTLQVSCKQPLPSSKKKKKFAGYLEKENIAKENNHQIQI